MLLNKNLPFRNYCIIPLLEADAIDIRTFKQINRRFKEVFSNLGIKVIHYIYSPLRRAIKHITTRLMDYNSVDNIFPFYLAELKNYAISRPHLNYIINQYINDFEHFKQLLGHNDELKKFINKIQHPIIEIDLNNISTFIFKNIHNYYCICNGLCVELDRVQVILKIFDNINFLKIPDYHASYHDQLSGFIVQNIKNNIIKLQIKDIYSYTLRELPNLQFLKTDKIYLFEQCNIKYIKAKTIFYQSTNQNLLPNLEELCVEFIESEPDIQTLKFQKLKILKINILNKDGIILCKKGMYPNIIPKYICEKPLELQNLNTLILCIKDYIPDNLIFREYHNYFSLLEQFLIFNQLTNINKIIILCKYIINHPNNILYNGKYIREHKITIKNNLQQFIKKIPSCNINIEFNYYL